MVKTYQQLAITITQGVRRIDPCPMAAAHCFRKRARKLRLRPLKIPRTVGKDFERGIELYERMHRAEMRCSLDCFNRISRGKKRVITNLSGVIEHFDLLD